MLRNIRKNSEEHNALKLKIMLTTIFQHPTRGKESTFHVPSCTGTFFKVTGYRRSLII